MKPELCPVPVTVQFTVRGSPFAVHRSPFGFGVRGSGFTVCRIKWCWRAASAPPECCQSPGAAAAANGGTGNDYLATLRLDLTDTRGKIRGVLWNLYLRWIAERNEQENSMRSMTRILEKQNRVQMSQVLFRGPHSSHQVVLLFKDSKARPLSPADATPSAAYLPLTSRWSEARPR